MIEKVKQYLAEQGYADRLLEFAEPGVCATVELAAQAVGCQPAHIAKSLGFCVPENSQLSEQGFRCLLVVAAGDAKVDNSRFKQQFGFKAKMLPAEQAEPLIGHAVGGVCPFALNPGVAVYLDDSLKRFATVYPAAGSSNSAVRLSLPELEKLSQSLSWVNVCKAWREDEQ